MNRLIRHPLRTVDRLLLRVLPREAYARLAGYGPLSRCEAQLAAAIAEGSSPVFVFPPPSVAWGYLFQRPQQLARALARFGHPVLYAADSAFPHPPDNRVRGTRRLDNGVILFADGRDGRMIASVKRPVICWQYWPHQRGFQQHLPPGSKLVYDCVDDLRVFTHYPNLRRDHADTLSRADLVLASSHALVEKIRPVRSDVLLVPNGVAYEDFAAPPVRRSAQVDRLRRQSEIIVGYYGALAEWIDWDLLVHVASIRREWTFLLVGDAWLSMPGLSRLRRQPNVHIWPRQPYEQLGNLLAAFDVAIIPFQVNEVTHSVSPIKLFEYLAGGKPVVSTPLDECRRYDVVRIGATPTEFVREIEWCLAMGRSRDYRARLQSCALGHSWANRVETVLRALEEKGISSIHQTIARA